MITVRPSSLSHVPVLLEIQKQAFKPLYEIYHDAQSPYLRGADDIIRRIECPAFRQYTIFSDSEIVGGIYYHVSGSTLFIPDLTPGEYYLGRVYISPAAQDRHIARTAILLCEKQFPDMKKCWVDFPADLEKNRRCYKGAGFAETGRTIAVQPGLTLELLEKTILP